MKVNVRNISYGPVGCILFLATFGLSTEFDISIILLSVFGIFAALNRSLALSDLKSPIFISIIFYVVAQTVSTAFSIDYNLSISFSVSLLPALLLYYLIAFYTHNLRDLRLVYAGFMLSGLIVAGEVLYRAVFSTHASAIDLATAVTSPLIVVPNDAIFFSVTTVFAMSLFFVEAGAFWRLLTLTSAIAGLGAMVVLESRGAIISALIATSAFVFVLRPRLVLPAAGLILIVVILIDGFGGFALLQKFGNLTEGRLSIWIAALHMFMESPWVGHGPHTFVLLYNEYVGELEASIWFPVEARLVPWAHNLYLESLAEQGLLGFTALAIVLVQGIRTAWISTVHARNSRSIYSAGVFATIVTVVFAGIYELSMIRIWVVVVIFVSLGVITSLSCKGQLDIHRQE